MNKIFTLLSQTKIKSNPNVRSVLSLTQQFKDCKHCKYTARYTVHGASQHTSIRLIWLLCNGEAYVIKINRQIRIAICKQSVSSTSVRILWFCHTKCLFFFLVATCKDGDRKCLRKKEKLRLWCDKSTLIEYMKKCEQNRNAVEHQRISHGTSQPWVSILLQIV